MKIKRNTTRRVMADTEVTPEASELLFEATDVAELLAEATGEDVEVTTDGDTVEFAVGEETYVAEPEGDEEVVESSVRIKRNKSKVSASTYRGAGRRPIGKTVRKMPRRK